MPGRREFLVFSAAFAASAPFQVLAGGHGRIGSFKGESGHVTTGRAEIVTSGGQSTVTLLDDFTFDGAPDPKVALGQNGYDKDALLAPLKSNSGKQIYTVPANIDAAKFNEVWIWCERFNVPLGVAKIN